MIACRHGVIVQFRRGGGKRNEAWALAVVDANRLGNKVRAAMDETPGPETGGQPEKRVRKPWHAPRFIVSELASTDASTHANTDGGPPGTNLS
jgi:hypothetical protein